MCLIICLPAFRPKVPNTRSRCSIKANKTTINLDVVGARDITDDVIRTIDIMLY